MELIKRDSYLWSYLTDDLRGLIRDGELLLDYARGAVDKTEISDYSFLVFPFSKAYEGFLKKFFLDLGLIKEREYKSDEIRVGRILNPNFLKSRGNIFSKISGKSKTGESISHRMWSVWKRGRNLVFHYFPHNFRKLSYDEALDVIREILDVMDDTVSTSLI